MKLRNVLFGLAGLVAAVCGSDEKCYNGYYQNVTSYAVKAESYTPKGIGLDNPKNPEYEPNPEEIDWQVDDLEACLTKNFLENPVISPEDASPEKGWCLKTEFPQGIEIKRNCITVKVPDDLYKSACTERWLFPCNVDPQLCRDKGFEPTPECPCHCRAIVQDENYIITEHKLEVFRGELARVVTTCNNPWVVKQISPCLNNPHYPAEDQGSFSP